MLTSSLCCLFAVYSSPVQPADVELSSVRRIRRMGRFWLPDQADVGSAVDSIGAVIGAMLFLVTQQPDQQAPKETNLEVHESHGFILLVSYAAHLFLGSRQIL